MTWDPEKVLAFARREVAENLALYVALSRVESGA